MLRASVRIDPCQRGLDIAAKELDAMPGERKMPPEIQAA
jgi:hypothetical protein